MNFGLNLISSKLGGSKVNHSYVFPFLLTFLSWYIRNFFLFAVFLFHKCHFFSSWFKLEYRLSEFVDVFIIDLWAQHMSISFLIDLTSQEQTGQVITPWLKKSIVDRLFAQNGALRAFTIQFRISKIGWRNVLHVFEKELSKCKDTREWGLGAWFDPFSHLGSVTRRDEIDFRLSAQNWRSHLFSILFLLD